MRTAPPTSDKGEPHTQEHLLLGKGNRGRAVATLGDADDVVVERVHGAVADVLLLQHNGGCGCLLRQLRMRLDALLHPDYTDEEVRREVRNFGVTENADGTLRLEEKGTVYNEMVSTIDKSGSQLYRAMDADLYGPSHPLAYEAGGTPEALRTLTPAEIRAFRDARLLPGKHGHGGVVSDQAAARVGTRARRADSDRASARPEQAESAARRSSRRFPRRAPPRRRRYRSSRFPTRTPSSRAMWPLPGPPTASWGLTDYLLLQLFLENFAGDADTPLYKRFIDAKTRTDRDGRDRRLRLRVRRCEGQPVFIGLSDVQAVFADP